MITIIKLRDLFADLSSKGMAQVFADWEMLVGFEASAEAQSIRIAAGVESIRDLVDPRQLVVETKVEKGDAPMGSILFTFPNGLVVDVIADLLMIPDSARAIKAMEGLSENDIEAFREMANLLCGSWNRVFQELERDLRISQSVEDLQVWTGDGKQPTIETCAPEGRLAYVPLEVDCAGAKHEALITLPFEVAIGIADEFYGQAA